MGPLGYLRCLAPPPDCSCFSQVSSISSWFLLLFVQQVNLLVRSSSSPTKPRIGPLTRTQTGQPQSCRQGRHHIYLLVSFISDNHICPQNVLGTVRAYQGHSATSYGRAVGLARLVESIQLVIWKIRVYYPWFNYRFKSFEYIRTGSWPALSDGYRRLFGFSSAMYSNTFTFVSCFCLPHLNRSVGFKSWWCGIFFFSHRWGLRWFSTDETWRGCHVSSSAMLIWFVG